MAKYKFSPDERYAVFTVYDQHCYICKAPVDFRSVHIDHVIPEALLATPEKLQEVLEALGLPSTFDLNAFGNWLPSCGPCNLSKGQTTFEPSLLIQRQLQRARNRAPRAEKFARRSLSDRQVSNAYAVVESALSRGDLAPKAIMPLVQLFLSDHPDLKKLYMDRAVRTNLSFTLAPPQVAELRLTGFAKVVFNDGNIEIVATPLGTGFRPTSPNPDGSFYCGHCGSLGPWSGARCLTCGYLDGGD